MDQIIPSKWIWCQSSGWLQWSVSASFLWIHSKRSCSLQDFGEVHKGICQVQCPAQAGSFQARDNITKFISGCEKVGISKISLFTTEDLIGRKNDKQVLTCLLQLSRVGAKHGVSPPQIIQYELDIEEAQSESKNIKSSDKVEEVEEDEDVEEDHNAESYGLTEEQFEAIVNKFESLKRGGVVSKKQLATALLDDAKVAHLIKEDASFGNYLTAVKADQDASVDLEEFLDVVKATQDGSEKKVDAESSDSQKKRVVDRRNYLPYSPKKGDEIDEALAEIVNEHQLNIRILKVKAKKGRKVRGSKVQGAYYVGPGKGKVYFRLLKGLLMARLGHEWEDVAHFLERKVNEVYAA